MAIKETDYASSGTTAPAGYAAELVIANTDLAFFTRGIYIGVSGDVVVMMAAESNVVTFKNVPAGQILPIRIRQLRAGTTAASVVALYG